MCLIVVAWRARDDVPLVVAANRDEWRERPTQAAHWWADPPSLLAGRDLSAGGTWLGITRSGRFAAITNFRDPSQRRSTAPSRGGLVTGFLAGDDPSSAYVTTLAGQAAAYNGFNLLACDGRELWYFGSRAGPPIPVAAGIHGLSNHVLDEPWPKVIEARAALSEAMHERDPLPRMIEAMGRDALDPASALPDTGVGADWERRLGPALIKGQDYGTRSTTVLAVHSDGRARWIELTRGPDGEVIGTVAHDFEIEGGP